MRSSKPHPHHRQCQGRNASVVVHRHSTMSGEPPLLHTGSTTAKCATTDPGAAQHVFGGPLAPGTVWWATCSSDRARLAHRLRCHCITPAAFQDLSQASSISRLQRQQRQQAPEIKLILHDKSFSNRSQLLQSGRTGAVFVVFLFVYRSGRCTQRLLRKKHVFMRDDCKNRLAILVWLTLIRMLLHP